MRKLTLALAAFLFLLTAQAWAGPAFELRQFTPYEGGYSPEWRARGIIKNTGDQRAYFVKVYVDLHNKNTGTYIKKEYGYVNGTTALTGSGMSVDTTIAPGEWVTFQILFSDESYADTEARNIRVVYDTYDSAPETKAKPVVTLLQSVKDRWGEWSAVGVLENQGTETAYFVKVQCDLFSFKDPALGHVDNNYFFLGDDWTYIDGQNGTTPNGTNTDTMLSPGAKATFWSILSGVPFDLVQYARTTTNWDEYGSRTSGINAAASQTLKPAKSDGREAWEQYKEQQEALRIADPGQMQIQILD
jgi:hypothetical protein